MKHKVIYEYGPNEQGCGTWSACVPDLIGVMSYGHTREECEAHIREAIELYFATMRDKGLPRPEPSSEAA